MLIIFRTLDEYLFGKVNQFLSSKAILFSFVLIFSFQTIGYAGSSSSSKWVGTWSCAPYAAAENTPPSPYLANNTLRQIVRTSIGGDTLRLKFSNITCSTPVTMNSVNIAVSTEVGGSAIDASSIKQLKFNGNTKVTMDPYSSVTSDAFAFPLTPGMHLAITIYYGDCKTAADMTFHYGSRTDSYILKGDQAEDPNFEGATAVERWYNLNTIEVLAPQKSGAVVALGNSITDGYGLHGGLKNKWTDIFSENLLANSATAHVSVLNMGIGATFVTSSGVPRFQQDVLDMAGVRWVIVFYGVNDIGGGRSANDIISAFQQMIFQAHAQNIRIYGATITPFKGNGYYSYEHEDVRREVNEWIRKPGNFDQCIDLDQAIRDPNDVVKLKTEYSNDWLHPNTPGYRILGESIDLNLFLGGDTIFEQPAFESTYFEPECATIGNNWETIADKQASNAYYVAVKAGTESKDAAPATVEGLITIPFSVDSTGEYSVSARLNCPSADDDSFWIKLDDGEFEMINGLATSGWQWKTFVTYALELGDHLLTIGYREDGAKLDKICVSNSPFPPSGMGNDAENICEPGIGGNSIPVFEDNDFRIFPNPADSQTNIAFRLNESSTVSLKIYDIEGRNIATLVNKNLIAGSYNMVWDASGLSCGQYTCQLIAGNTTINRRILLTD
ncbi:MAG: GDSL-type esterase/lipase family protein [Prolixibacteraceae bacterium]